MGLRLKIEGNESIHLPETSIITVQFGADIPHDSNARSTDLGSTVLMKGKILAAVNGEAADDTSKIARWSLVPAENSDCYRNVQIDVISPRWFVKSQYPMHLSLIMKRILRMTQVPEPSSF